MGNRREDPTTWREEAVTTTWGPSLEVDPEQRSGPLYQLDRWADGYAKLTLPGWGATSGNIAIVLSPAMQVELAKRLLGE